MRAAGAIICMTGGHGWFIGREADGPDDVRRAVREQLKAGADCLKFTATGGGMTPGVDPRASSFTEAELAAGVDEAHKAFRRAIAHAQGNAGIRTAVRAGIDSVEHGVYLDDEVDRGDAPARHVPGADAGRAGHDRPARDEARAFPTTW